MANESIDFDFNFNALGAEQQLGKTIAMLEKVKTSVQSVDKQTQKSGKRTLKSLITQSKTYKGITSALKKMRGPAMAVSAGFAAIAGAIGGTYLAFKKLVSIQQNQQKQTFAIMRYGEEGRKALDALTKHGEAAGHTMDTMRKVTGQMLDAFEPSSVVRVTKALTDLAAQGGDLNKLSELTHKFAKSTGMGTAEIEEFAKASGVGYAETINQIANISGGSIDEVKRAAKAGTLQIEEVLAAAQQVRTGGRGYGLFAIDEAGATGAMARLSNLWNGFLESLADNILSDEIIKSFSELADSLKKFLPPAIKVITKVFTWLINNKEIIIGVFAGIAVIVGAMLFPFWKIIAIAAGVTAGITALILVFKNAGKIWDAITKGMSKAWEWYINYLKNVLNIFKNIFIGAIDFVKNAFNAWIDHIFTFPEKMLDLGKNIVSGLIDGIKNKFGALVKTMKDLAGNVTGPFRKILGINSPAKELISDGRDIGLGAAEGIEEETPTVHKAIARMVDLGTVEKTIRTQNKNNISTTINVNGTSNNGRVSNDILDFAVPVLNESLSKALLA